MVISRILQKIFRQWLSICSHSKARMFSSQVLLAVCFVRLSSSNAVPNSVYAGIGAACALALAEAGASLCLIVRPPAQNLSIVDTIRDKCPSTRLEAVYCDLSDIEAVKAIFQKALDVMDGQIHVLVNCAGMQRRAPALQFSEQDWDDVSFLFYTISSFNIALSSTHRAKLLPAVIIILFPHPNSSCPPLPYRAIRTTKLAPCHSFALMVSLFVATSTFSVGSHNLMGISASSRDDGIDEAHGLSSTLRHHGSSLSTFALRSLDLMPQNGLQLNQSLANFLHNSRLFPHVSAKNQALITRLD